MKDDFFISYMIIYIEDGIAKKVILNMIIDDCLQNNDKQNLKCKSWFFYICLTILTFF